MNLLLSLVYCLSFLNIIATNTTINDQYVSSLIFYRNRFYVCLPDSVLTLYEASWIGVYSKITKLKPFTNQKLLNTCKSMDLDTRGRIWILDVPKSNEINAKIIVYSILTYTELQTCDLKNVVKNNLNTIAIDPVINTVTGSKAYIGYSNVNEILVYALKERRYWRLKFSNKNIPFDISGSFLTISKKESILYLSGKADEQMYSINLNIVRKLHGPPAIVDNETPIYTNVTYLGNKLGPSTSLISDLRGNVYYYLIRDYAVVRWNSKKSLQAENHKILLQSAEKLPFVTQFFVGPQYSIWAVVNNSTSVSNATTKEFNLLEKIIKIAPLF